MVQYLVLINADFDLENPGISVAQSRKLQQDNKRTVDLYDEKH